MVVRARIDPALQRERVLANRAPLERPDVIDAVLTGHAESLESPVDEEPIVVGTAATRDALQAAAGADAIRTRNVRRADEEARTETL